MIDATIISLYLFLILAVGLYNRNKSTTLSGYAHVGSDINSNKFILTATIFASAVGGGTCFGITEKAFGQNLAFLYGLLLTIPIDLAIAIYLVPKMIKYNGANSVGEIVEKYYGKYARIITGISATLISIGYLAVQISVTGRIFSFLFAIDYIYAVILSYVIVIIYTTIGGLRSVVINNSLQFFAMIIAIPTVTIFGLDHVGIAEFIHKVPSEKYDIFSSNSLLLDTIFATLSFSVMGFVPSFIQRILIGQKSEPIKQAIYFKTAIYAIFIICLSLNGLIAMEIFPQLSSISSVTSIIDFLIPSGLKAFVIIGLLAAAMSTADSDLNISAISIANDIFRPLNINYSEERLLNIAKFMSIFIGISVILIALSFETIVELVIFSAGFWAPVALVPLVGIFFNRIISKTGFYSCVLSGSLTFLITSLIKENQAISSIFLGTFVSLICFIIFYKFSPSLHFLQKNRTISDHKTLI